MVDTNATLFPLWGSIGTVVNAVKVLIGGAFGLYLIMLYFRIREYIVVRRLLMNLHNDIRFIADKQGIEMPPKWRPPTVTAYVVEKVKEKYQKRAARKKDASGKKQTKPAKNKKAK